jgi:hypothetical protein
VIFSLFSRSLSSLRSLILLPALIFLIFFLTVGCKKEEASENVTYRAGAVEKTSKNFLIPRDLREVIEKSYLEFIRKENPKVVLPDEAILGRIPRDFLNVTVRLRSSAPGVLTHHSEFALPRGGGEIDLKDYVVGKKGSFFMTVEARRSDSPKEELKNLQIFFLSESKQRLIGKEKFGAGCKKFMDITALMAHHNTQGGIQLNATDQRYLSVVGGIFYFINFDPERRIYIAAVRFKDSRYKNLLCEPETVSIE